MLRALEIMEHFDPLMWVIENPATGLLKTRPFMERLPWVDVTYYKYGTPYRKQTRLWTNVRWRPSRGLCRRGSRCDAWEDGRHLRGAQGGPRLMGGSKMYSILTVQPDGARKEKRKIKGVPKKAVTNVRHLEYREVLEEGRPSRSRLHGEKKSLSPFNDKVYGLDAHNSRPLKHWRNLEQLRMLGAYAPPGSAPFDLVMEFLVGPPPLGPAPALPLRLSRCWA